jgi:hypothetical protein
MSQTDSGAAIVECALSAEELEQLAQAELRHSAHAKKRNGFLCTVF